MPPQAIPTGQDAPREMPEAASVRFETLKKRRDFLRAGSSARYATPGFILQMHTRVPGECDGVRVGFTCSKKVGNAIARNRAKRRLRAIARLQFPELGREGCDYVLVGRRGATADLPFDVLQKDLARAITKLHARYP